MCHYTNGKIAQYFSPSPNQDLVSYAYGLISHKAATSMANLNNQSFGDL